MNKRFIIWSPDVQPLLPHKVAAHTVLKEWRTCADPESFFRGVQLRHIIFLEFFFSLTRGERIQIPIKVDTACDYILLQ